jgi:hypothetical protein
VTFWYGTVPLTNTSGCGSGRPKNIRNVRIRSTRPFSIKIRNAYSASGNIEPKILRICPDLELKHYAWKILLPRQKQSPVVASHVPAALSSCPLHWQGRQPAAAVALPQLPGAQLAQAGPAVWCSQRSQRPRPWLHRLCWWQPQSALQSLPVQPTSHSHCITTCGENKY